MNNIIDKPGIKKGDYIIAKNNFKGLHKGKRYKVEYASVGWFYIKINKNQPSYAYLKDNFTKEQRKPRIARKSVNNTMKHSVFDNIEYLNEPLVTNVRKDADKKFGTNNSLQKSLWIITEYRHRDGHYKINPKRKIKSKNGGYLSRVKKLKAYESRLKVNVSKRAEGFLITREMEALAANENLSQKEKDWLGGELQYFINATDTKIENYIIAKRGYDMKIKYLNKQLYQQVKEEAKKRFDKDVAPEVVSLWVHRMYSDRGGGLQYGPHLDYNKFTNEPNLDNNVSAAPGEENQGLPSGEDSWIGFNPDDFDYKNKIESISSLTSEEKMEMIFHAKNLAQRKNELEREMRQKGYEFKTFTEYPG